MSNTVKLHRFLKAPVERVYRAFIEPDAIVKWFAPHGFTCKVHSLDVRVGGSYKMSFTNFSTGNGHSFGGEYTEIEPNKLIKHTDKFDDSNIPEEMDVTITFKEVVCGTELHITQENLPKVIPVEMCYLGWQETLSMLANLVEPEISDA